MLALCAAVRDHADDLAAAQSEAANAVAMYQSQSGEVTRLEALVAAKLSAPAVDRGAAINRSISAGAHVVEAREAHHAAARAYERKPTTETWAVLETAQARFSAAEAEKRSAAAALAITPTAAETH